MKKSSNNFIKDKIVKAGLVFSFLILLFGILYTVYIFNNLPPLIPIFNQLPWGMQRIGSKTMIFLPIGLNISMLIVNVLFSKFFYDKMPLVIRMVSITSLLVSFIVMVFIIRTSFLLL